ncbi:2',5'-phosphodiesterase 12 [Rhinoraja longicauda]
MPGPRCSSQRSPPHTHRPRGPTTTKAPTHCRRQHCLLHGAVQVPQLNSPAEGQSQPRPRPRLHGVTSLPGNRCVRPGGRVKPGRGEGEAESMPVLLGRALRLLQRLATGPALGRGSSLGPASAPGPHSAPGPGSSAGPASAPGLGLGSSPAHGSASSSAPGPGSASGLPPGSGSASGLPPGSRLAPGSYPMPGSAMQTAVVRCVPSETKMTIALEVCGSQRRLEREQSECLRASLARIAHHLLKAQTGSRRGKKAPGPALDSARTQGQTRAQSQGQAPDQAQGQAPDQAQGQAPDQAQGQAPDQAQGQAPDQAQGQAPDQAQGQAPDQAQGQAPDQAQGQAPDQAQGQAPDQAPAPEVSLYVGEQAVPGHTSNEEAWQEGAVLQVGSARYRVQRNPPGLTLLALPASILAGFPVCPRLQVEFGQAADCRFEWLREAEDGHWEPVADGRVFTPPPDLVGRRLKLRCRPGDGSRLGPETEALSSGPVQLGPEACTCDDRHSFTQQAAAGPVLRVVSYNILADIYVQTELSKTTLYPYCPPHALHAHYRENLVKKEVLGYQADLLCLQEVDKTLFSHSLQPALDAFGYQGLFRVKEKQHEGLATFYRASRFQLLSQHDVTLGQALASDPLHTNLLQEVAANPSVQEQVLQKSTALQVCVLQSLGDPSRKVCVANTHLYWHPKGGHIRLIQIAIAFRHLQQITSELHPNTPIIFCGDFNSSPSSGLFDFVTKGSISPDHQDWTSNGQEEQCRISLTHPFKLGSACGEPAYTNYVGDFQGCLDYVFMDVDALEVTRVIPFPPHEEITRHLALPSVSHPSDHIALVCDLAWK